ncbi:MAG: glycoside hydrolase [Actinomycetota bacterium]|nr:glycoside hydrolase [Actinomycetota bacterium]
MPEGFPSSLSQRAVAVLDHNRRGDWTCPANGMYAHQWLWDSCFVAIGLAGQAPQRAADELRALLRGQWANGMVPHIVFADGAGDIGSRRMWRSKRNPLAPRDVETSCITQPPLIAVAAWRVAQAMLGDERRAFLAEVYPKILRHHEWLYRDRDLRQTGLVTLMHPWECGLDTTPPWMEELSRAPGPWWLRLALLMRLAKVVRFVRTDTRFAPATQRPSDDDGLRMLVLARHAARHHFDLRRMPARGSVLIEDLAFNALLVVANRCLVRIAGDLDQTIDSGLESSMRRTETALDELWDEPTGQYYSRNANTGALIKSPTIATFLPLWAGVPSRARAEQLVALLRDPGFWPEHPVPSVPTGAPDFEADRYWKGPTWINMNWAVIQGLALYDEVELAEDLRQRTLQLIGTSGFSEYFSALTGCGFGAHEFSWTAALALDLMIRPPDSNADAPAPS